MHHIFGTIEIDSVDEAITLRCLIDGAELVIDWSAPRLFDERTLAFYETHSPSTHLAGTDCRHEHAPSGRTPARSERRPRRS